MWADEIDEQLLPLSWKSDSNETTPKTDNHEQITIEQTNAEDLNPESLNADKSDNELNANYVYDNSNANEMNDDNSSTNDLVDDSKIMSDTENTEYERYNAKDSIQSVHFSFSDVGNFAFQKTADKTEFLNSVAAQPSTKIDLKINNDESVSTLDRVTFNFVNNDDNHEMVNEKSDAIKEHEWNIQDDVINNKDFNVNHIKENEYLSQVTNIEPRPNYLDENGNVVTSEWLKEIELRRSLSSDQESLYQAGADKLQPRVGQSDILGKYTFISIPVIRATFFLWYALSGLMNYLVNVILHGQYSSKAAHYQQYYMH